MKVIGSSWKFILKRDKEGNINKYKARLIARGDQQEPVWNFVFSPTVRYTSLRVLLAIACHQDLEVEQMVVNTSFLNADVETNVYMLHPEGHEVTSKNGELVCHLRKALYGIREAPRALNALLTEWFVSYGWKQSLVDPGIFTSIYDLLLYILGLHVDDSILCRESRRIHPQVLVGPRGKVQNSRFGASKLATRLPHRKGPRAQHLDNKSELVHL